MYRAPVVSGTCRQLAEETEQVVGLSYDVVQGERAIAKGGPKATIPPVLDRVGTREAMRPAARELAGHLMTMAQADALDMMGERERPTIWWRDFRSCRGAS